MADGPEDRERDGEATGWAEGEAAGRRSRCPACDDRGFLAVEGEDGTIVLLCPLCAERTRRRIFRGQAEPIRYALENAEGATASASAAVAGVYYCCFAGG
jgi:hypothetical protein